MTALLWQMKSSSRNDGTLFVCFQDMVYDENSPKHIERLYCGHLLHQECLLNYLKLPPFGNKKCTVCGVLIFHAKWRLSDKLAEARWAHEQARERELAEVEDFFKWILRYVCFALELNLCLSNLLTSLCIAIEIVSIIFKKVIKIGNAVPYNGYVYQGIYENKEKFIFLQKNVVSFSAPIRDTNYSCDNLIISLDQWSLRRVVQNIRYRKAF